METILSLDASAQGGALVALPEAPTSVASTATTTTEELAAAAITASTMTDPTTAAAAAATTAFAAVAVQQLVATATAAAAYHQHKRSMSAAAVELVLELANQLEIERTLVVEGTVEQPLQHILQDHPVVIQATSNHDSESLQHTLQQLDRLIAACSNEYPSDKYLGRAPGFWTMTGCAQGGHLVSEWRTNPTMPMYQTINVTQAASTKLPLPSPACAKRVYQALRQAYQERLEFMAMAQRDNNNNYNQNDYCSCIAGWWKGQVVARQLVNQVMEQVMVEEASDFLKQDENFTVASWTASYFSTSTTKTTSTDQDLPLYSSPMQLLSHRDSYISILVKALMAAKTSVMISTCYLFYQDPAQLYVLLDLLPFIAKQHGVKVFFMMDLFVFESNMLASPFRVVNDTDTQEVKPLVPKQKGKITNWSFLEHLPQGSPTPNKAYTKFESQYHLFDQLLQLSLDDKSNFELRFWCARDATSGYRIKNHSKGIVVDDQWALFGGSNLTPTVRSAKADLDCLVTGLAAKAVADTFWDLLTAVDPTIERPSITSDMVNADLQADKFLVDAANTNTTKPCTFSILQSTPSATGEDCIYRVVLEHLETAQESITVSMGHCAFPQSFVDALSRAAARGVKTIQCMVNSYHSNDLRGGQADLFKSIHQLLQQVPTAQVFATHCNDAGDRPEFLHGKYVIVDGQWSCLGSWNLWTRSSFYELEMEAFVESADIAAQLQAKFDKERIKNAVAVTMEDCIPGNKFCPKGCQLCKGFGPFFM